MITLDRFTDGIHDYLDKNTDNFYFLHELKRLLENPEEDLFREGDIVHIERIISAGLEWHRSNLARICGINNIMFDEACKYLLQEIGYDS